MLLSTLYPTLASSAAPGIDANAAPGDVNRAGRCAHRPRACPAAARTARAAEVHPGVRRLVQPRPGSLPAGRRAVFPCLPAPPPPGRFALPCDVMSWFAGYEQPLPELPALTHVNECIASPIHRLPPHTHAAFEIVYINAGASEWWAGDDHRRVQR